jgi:hypothetical protein
MVKKTILLLLLLAPILSCHQGSPSGTPAWDPAAQPTKRSSPIITPTQQWEANNIEDGSVVKVGPTYYRFYCAGDAIHNIGYATAENFPTAWTKYAANPIILASSFYAGAGISVCAPRVVPMPDGSFRMYVHAFDGVHDRGFLLTSSAAAFPNAWTLANGSSPIFSEGAPGQWDGVQIQTQSIIPVWESPDSVWHMYYIGFDGTAYRGGHATSPDGITWTRDAGNPVMIPGGDWRSQDIGPLGYFRIGTTFYVLAQGFDGSAWSVGYYSTDNFRDLMPSAAPILVATPGTWDSSGIEGVDAFQDGSNIWLFYLGSNVPNPVAGGSNYSVGLANWQ